MSLSPEKGKRYYIKFEAVGQKAKVYCNGYFLGEHLGGYTGFVFELTDTLRNGDNTITVIADNRQDWGMPPLGGDFNMFGGIYRDVCLLTANEHSFSRDFYGAPGLLIGQSSVHPQAAELEIRAVFSAKLKGGERLSLDFFDQTGCSCSSQNWPVESQDHKYEMTIDNPQLWEGRENPYLYHYKASFHSSDGCLLDQLEGQIGLRSYHVDFQGNFFLNGKKLLIQGVSRHQDLEGKGNALTAEDHKRDFDIIADMGANAVRLAHYPQAQSIANYCDQQGIILWAELPFVGYYRFRKPSKRLIENSLLQLKEMICQHYNSCSHFFWGLFNEMSNTERTADFIRRLHACAKELDTWRLTVSATAAEGSANRVADLYCWNRYFGWYEGEPEDLKRFIEDQKVKYPEGKLGISEYGAGGDPYCHREDLQKPGIKSYVHPEKWQTYFHESNWKIIKDAPVWGSFVWAMFDFSSAGRKEGARASLNDKGLVSFDREIYKDAYYFYKANWSREELVYITERRFEKRENRIITVKAYSTIGPLDLYVNSIPVARAEVDEIMRCIWHDIELEKEDNHLELRDQNGKLRDKVIFYV